MAANPRRHVVSKAAANVVGTSTLLYWGLPNAKELHNFLYQNHQLDDGYIIGQYVTINELKRIPNQCGAHALCILDEPYLGTNCILAKYQLRLSPSRNTLASTIGQHVSTWWSRGTNCVSCPARC